MGFAVMTLTPAAADRVKTILKMSDNAAGIRVSIKKGGCAGMEYAIDLATDVNPKDDRIERDGATVFVAPKPAMPWFAPSKPDFASDKLSQVVCRMNPEKPASH